MPVRHEAVEQTIQALAPRHGYIAAPIPKLGLNHGLGPGYGQASDLARGPADEPPSRPEPASVSPQTAWCNRPLAWAVALLVLLFLGVGGVVLATQDTDIGRGTAASDAQHTSDDTDTDEDGNNALQPTRSPSKPEPKATLTCWNNSTAASRASCPPVRGRAGMRWAFPILANFHCVPGRLYDGKVLARQCEVPLSNGHISQVVFSEWGTWDQGQAHYGEKFGSKPSRHGNFDIWGPAKFENSTQASVTFAATLPYSFTMAAGSHEDLAEVLTLMEVRSAAETRGYR